ncbi:MAG: branched-chain amino acid transport system permease protein [Candidatus Eremiobacteraeota bacterium]|jgi:branched-chain amino acid transport system permease protein|nr:branched-chain amino acid transport system permease protein [Candidatus Eremiobacteraeota bacterium]
MGGRRALWIAGIIGVAALLPVFVHSDYVLTLLDLAGIYAIAVMGLGILLGFTGQMSLAQAAFLGIGAYTSAWFTTHLGWPVWPAMAAAIVMSALVGLAVGYPCLRLSGHYLALATIGFGIIAQLVLINWKAVTNGSDGITGIPPPQIGPWVLDTYGKYYYLVLAAVLLCAYIAWRIKTTRVGRALHAIRENEIAARATGIDATRYKIIAFVLAGAYAGLAGSLLAHDIKFISPDSYSFDQSVVFLVMLILGGSSSISGAIIGALLLTMLPEVLRPLKSSYIMVYGAAVIAMIVFMPQGLVGLFSALRTRFEPRTPPRASAPAGLSNTPSAAGAPGAEPA